MVISESQFVDKLSREIGKVIVGQKYLVERVIVAVLCGGHLLVEGVPGLAKTLAIKTVAQAVKVDFKRIQFTPDLLPADIIGTMIFNQKSSEFTPNLGPIFTNFVLADEINRAPAKVQSALLEAMQERQVTIAEKSYQLPNPFMVMATQNPIEQEGTYPLPEAQVDRFMLKVKIGYPSREEEKQIMERWAIDQNIEVEPVISAQEILQARKVVEQIYVDEKIKNYIVDLVMASRYPAQYKLTSLEGMLEYGASPRATLYLNMAARAHAFLRHRGFVTPEDIKAVGLDVLRHRVIPTYEAEAEEMSTDQIVETIFQGVEVP